MRRLLTIAVLFAWLLLGHTSPVNAVHAEGVLNGCGKFLNPPSGAQCFTVSGFNNDVGNGAFETIWPLGGAFPFPATEETWYISSSHVDDDQEIVIRGHSGSSEFKVEIAELDGFTFVPLTGTWLRHLNSFNFTQTRTALQGTVYISSDNTDEDGGANGIPDDLADVRGIIVLGDEYSSQVAFSVPLDHECGVSDYAQAMTGSPGATETTDLLIRARTVDGGTMQAITRTSVSRDGSSSVPGVNPYPAPLMPKVDICIDGKSSDVNGSSVAISFNIVCLRCADCNP